MIDPIDSEPVLVDSSGWLEYITDDAKADLFAPLFETPQILLLPTVVVYEVRKILLLRQSKSLADRFVSEALGRSIVSLDEWIALEAASLSIDYHLPMADAIIYATARHFQARVVTSDAHFANLPGVTVL